MARRRRDERGATFVITAICMVLLLWAGAFGVDLGFSVDGGRQAQAMADTAALDLARYINIADATTVATTATNLNGKLANVLSDNNANTTFTITPGKWLNGAWQSVPGCKSGTPPTPLCNGVKIKATQSVPQIFGGGHTTVSRYASAAVTPEAGFSIGSYLASFSTTQVPVLNVLLSVLGTNANISAVGYSGLANTDVTIAQLITASGGLLTPSNVMTASLAASQWLTIWSDAVATQIAPLNCGGSPTPSACNSSTALGSLTFGGAPAALCQLVGINGAASCSTGALNNSQLNASLNVLQVLTTEAALANGGSALNLQSALGITGATSANLYLTLIQPPVVAYGPAGTVAQTAQMRADLQIGVLGSGLLDIPFASVASATATLSTLICSSTNSLFQDKIAVAGAAANTTVTLAGSSIGTLTLNSWSGNSTFASNAIPPTASTDQAGTNPVDLGSTSPSLTYSGTSLPVLTTALGVLAPVLQATGVSLGGAAVTYLSTACGAVSLVQ